MKNKIEIKNATISSSCLGFEGHGILSCNISLDYGGTGQGFGGYAFDTPITDGEGRFSHREGTAYGMEFINKILIILELEKWEDLPSTNIRVKAEYGKVHAIGHFIKDNWFDPEFDLKHLIKEK